jgi:hypothetical protein
MVRLCMRDLFPCFLKVLNLSSPKSDKPEVGKVKLASAGENWKRVKVPIKSYLEDMLSVRNLTRVSFYF